MKKAKIFFIRKQSIAAFNKGLCQEVQYTHVATIEVASPYHVYHKCQNFNLAWTAMRQRSMMVGDRFQMGNTMYEIAGCGLKEVQHG
jgi:hypothetical protein